MIDLEAIAERDRLWPGSSDSADCSGSTSAEADRHALLEYITDLEAIAEETMMDLHAIKDIVREKMRPDPPSEPRVPRAEQLARANKKWRATHGRRRLSTAQWRMLGELSEPNKNPENEWSFPHKRIRTGHRLVELGLAKEHELNTHRCVFSITDAGRKRLAKRGSTDGKVETRETP